jgi:hypothetical protein
MTMTTPSTVAARRSGFIGEIASVWHDLAHDLAKTLFDPYRPERYYMRGPGPARHAKHGLQRRDLKTRDVTPVAWPALPALVRVRW